MKKILTEREKNLQWLSNEIEKDKKELDKSKNDFIRQIRNFKKEDIVKPKPKLTLWKKILRILGL
jgi:hypothetical protein